jgi:hypothetical protein
MANLELFPDRGAGHDQVVVVAGNSVYLHPAGVFLYTFSVPNHTQSNTPYR